jgi:hypothetical protein
VALFAGQAQLRQAQVQKLLLLALDLQFEELVKVFSLFAEQLVLLQVAQSVCEAEFAGGPRVVQCELQLVEGVVRLLQGAELLLKV